MAETESTTVAAVDAVGAVEQKATFESPEKSQMSGSSPSTSPRDRDFLAAIDADGDGIISNDEILKAGFLVDTDGDGIISQEELKAAKKKYYRRKSHWVNICILSPKGYFVSLNNPDVDNPHSKVYAVFCDCDTSSGFCSMITEHITMPIRELCRLQENEDQSINENTMKKHVFINLKDRHGEFIKAKHVIKMHENKFGEEIRHNRASTPHENKNRSKTPERERAGATSAPVQVHESKEIDYSIPPEFKYETGIYIYIYFTKIYDTCCRTEAITRHFTMSKYADEEAIYKELLHDDEYDDDDDDDDDEYYYY